MAPPDYNNLSAETVAFLERSQQNMAELASARDMIAQQHKTIADMTASHTTTVDSLDLRHKLTTEELTRARDERNLFMRYAVELSTQLQFMVSGSVRALKIASTVQARLQQEIGNSDVPEVAGAEAAELEKVLAGLGKVNERANDGIGGTDKPDTNPVATPATQSMRAPVFARP